MSIKVVTYNIHKGFEQISRKLVLSEIRQLIRTTGADLVLLQEVVGANDKHVESTENWPDVSQFEFLADELWPHYSYGLNAIYDHGHHGNAILSRFPIVETFNTDISKNSYEQRGFLFARITIPERSEWLNVVCLHLNLFERHRKEQLMDLVKFIENKVDVNAPLIVAGDFNDWTGNVSRQFESSSLLTECFKSIYGRYAATFPSRLPLLSLDRIFVRNFVVVSSAVIDNRVTRKLSDHLPLFADLEFSDRIQPKLKI